MKRFRERGRFWLWPCCDFADNRVLAWSWNFVKASPSKCGGILWCSARWTRIDACNRDRVHGERVPQTCFSFQGEVLLYYKRTHTCFNCITLIHKEFVQASWSSQEAHHRDGCSFWNGIFAFEEHRALWFEMWQPSCQFKGFFPTHMQGDLWPSFFLFPSGKKMKTEILIVTFCFEKNV